MRPAAPLAAVVVPVYNAGAFLPACLRSIAAQTLQDFRCYLVDDGSSDGSGELCEAAGREDMRFVALHQAQCGVSAARAAGLRAALADGARWIAFCDADDLFHPDLLRVLIGAARSAKMPVACCLYDSFSGDAPADLPARPSGARVLAAPAHLEALLHDHAVDFSLCNKLYSAEALTPADLDNGYAYNEDLLANWQVFSRLPGCAFVDFVGYHYRQHPGSASHRPLNPASLDDQRRAAIYIREHAGPEMQQSADAFYYEKLVYLASMILRRADAADYRVQFNELGVGIRAGLRDPRLGKNPRLALSIKAAAWATVHCTRLWAAVCRRLLRDRQ